MAQSQQFSCPAHQRAIIQLLELCNHRFILIGTFECYLFMPLLKAGLTEGNHFVHGPCSLLMYTAGYLKCLAFNTDIFVSVQIHIDQGTSTLQLMATTTVVLFRLQNLVSHKQPWQLSIKAEGSIELVLLYFHFNSTLRYINLWKLAHFPYFYKDLRNETKMNKHMHL